VEAAVKLLVRNRTIRVESCTEREDRWLDAILSIPVPGAKYSIAFQNGHWDGLKHLYKPAWGVFPTGLLPLLMSENRSRTRAFEITLVDKRRPPVLPRSGQLSAERWERHLKRCGFEPDLERCRYQVQGIETILNSYFGELQWPRGIIQLPTGSGKTLLAAGFLWWMRIPRTVLLVNRLDLLLQTRDVFEKVLGRKVGVYGGGKQELRDVTVATVQTLGARLHPTKGDPDLLAWVAGVEVLIVDECHKVSDNAYLQIMDKVPAYYRLGLSATPLKRGDAGDAILVGSTGDVIFSLRAQDLSAAGLLATPLVEMLPIHSPVVDVTPPKFQFNAWKRQSAHGTYYRQVYKYGISENETRNMAIASRVADELSKKRPTMVLVKLIKHGHIIKECLASLGVDAEFLKGDDPVAYRRELVTKFKSGIIDVLIASTIFDEAVDIPNIQALVLAAGGASPIKAIQRVGRGMRAKGGENRLYVTDFLDLTHKLLKEHSLRRAEIYHAQGYEIKDAKQAKLELPLPSRKHA